MNENSIPTETIGGQARVFEALASMARAFPHLPAIYAPVYRDGLDIYMQAQTAGSFEAWREALGFTSADVELKEHNGAHWLRVQGTWAGVPVDLTSHAVDVPGEGQVVGAEMPEAWRAVAGAA